MSSPLAPTPKRDHAVEPQPDMPDRSGTIEGKYRKNDRPPSSREADHSRTVPLLEIIHRRICTQSNQLWRMSVGKAFQR